jgi:hypothetical protein
VALALAAAVVLSRSPGGHAGPWVVTTPNDNAGVNGAPDFRTMLPAGDGTLLEDVGNAYWCTTSSCAADEPLAPLRDSQFGLPAGGALPDGTPVLASLTEIDGDTLRLGLLHCAQRTCAEVGGGTFTAPGFSSAVAAAPHGGFAAAVIGGQGQVSVYRCAAAPCRTAAKQQVPGPSSDAIAITVTPSGQTLLAYGNSDFSVNTGSSQVVLGSVGPGGSFSQLAAVNAPVSNVDGAQYSGPPAPAIEFSGRDLLVVSENPSGHAVTLTTCAVTSCGNTTKVSQVATVGNPIVELGIGVPTGTPRIFWATQDTDILGAISYSGHLWIGNST